MIPDGIDPARIAHVAVVMDGNGRWAESRGLPHRGHTKGEEALFDTVEAPWSWASSG